MYPCWRINILGGGIKFINFFYRHTDYSQRLIEVFSNKREVVREVKYMADEIMKSFSFGALQKMSSPT